MLEAWSVVAQLIVPKTHFISIQISILFFSYEWDQTNDQEGQRNIFKKQIVDPSARIDILQIFCAIFLQKFFATFFSLSAKCDMMLEREPPTASPRAAGYPSLALHS